MSEKLLVGHTSPETAFVQPDYPYGRELRCKRRVWIESKPRLGQRFVYQTTNPKRDGEVWNKPHAGVYHTICVMYLDESNGHVEIAALGVHSPPDVVDEFVTRFGEAALMADPWIAKTLPVIRKLSEARRKRENPTPSAPPPVRCTACGISLDDANNGKPVCPYTNTHEHDFPGHRLVTSLVSAQEEGE